MHEVLKKLGEIGVVPVVKIEKASDAVPLGKALLAGDLPVAEITFRTAAAEDAIRALTRELPELLVGAGTVLTVEQVDRAVGAGAKFIVAPGFNPKVVDYCISKNACRAGISSPYGDRDGHGARARSLKFFPAGASGGLDFLKAIAAPFGFVQFMPTGGVDTSNMKDYLSFPRVLAVGGTWIVKDTAISAEGSTRSRTSRVRRSCCHWASSLPTWESTRRVPSRPWAAPKPWRVCSLSRLRTEIARPLQVPALSL